MSLARAALPALMYGTAWKKEETAQLVEKALLCGFRGIDTACQPKHYHEGGVGAALQRLPGIARSELFLQTKFTPLAGQDPASVPYNPSDAIESQVRQSFATSQQNLKVDFIDALLLHSPLDTPAKTLQAWRAMEELHAAGLVGMLGISNCYKLADLETLFQEAHIKPRIVQNRFYRQTHYDCQLRQWCIKNNVQYQGFWTLTANPHILTHPALLELAEKKGVSQAQLFFRFLTQQHVIPLSGTCCEKHMQDDIQIFAFSLTAAEMHAIEQLLASSR